MLSSAIRRAGALRRCTVARLEPPAELDLLRPSVGQVRGSAARPPVELHAGVITPAEEDALAAEADRYLRARRYEAGHFDGVIRHYRELQRPLRSWSSASRSLFERVASLAALPSGAELLPVHVLDLEAHGEISRHVDHVEYSGAPRLTTARRLADVARLRPLCGRREHRRPVTALARGDAAPARGRNSRLRAAPAPPLALRAARRGAVPLGALAAAAAEL
mmetsp:Transcript_20864/g.70585  ORF Transcript_20864/g.70585 Transcript_20864/m.70585 type:complete len:221 (+) Transcript_20864:122-784(+)